MQSPKNAWHYTTSQGLIGMLASHRVWATSAAYMNDSDEIRAGREALHRAIEKHEPPLDKWQIQQLSRMGVSRTGRPDDLFLLCASTDGDALTLWRSYGIGSEAEYAVNFDPRVSLLPIQQNDAESHPEPVPPGWIEDSYEHTHDGERFMAYDPDRPYSFGGDWAEVVYLRPTSTAAQEELASLLKLLRKPDKVNARVVPFFLDYLAGPDPTVRFKHPGFEDEDEVRALWTVSPWWRFVKYRPGRFGITPYIEVGASDGARHEAERESKDFMRAEEVGRLPIRSVRIGPTRAAKEAEKSLRMLLDAHGYGEVKIQRSSTPYR